MVVWGASCVIEMSNFEGLCFLLSNIFFGLRYLEMFAAKDIQSRCRYLRERKDVFK